MFHMRPAGLGFLIAAALAVLSASPAYAIRFPWPDPRVHPVIILNADEKIDTYFAEHPEWFAQDFAILGLHVTGASYGNTNPSVQQYTLIRNRLRYKNLIVGTAISGTTAVHDMDLHQYPSNAASIEDMSVRTRFLGPWIRDPKRQVVDLSDKVSAEQLQSGIAQLWMHVKGTLRFVDDAAIHPGVALMQPWESYCKNMAAIRTFAEGGLRSNVVFNVFARPWQLTDLETSQLISAVAGGGGNAVALPLPWSEKLKDDKNAMGWAIYRYRQLLDHGIVLILTPSDEAPIIPLSKWVATWRRPTDRVYFSIPYDQEPPI